LKRAIGIDFGTTNSALAVAGPGQAPRLAHFDGPQGPTPAFRSILYFEREGGEGPLHVAAGPRALARYQRSEERGRLVQSLKSFLSARAFSSTSILGSAYRLEGLIGTLLAELRSAAERELGALEGPVVAGRPVRFVGAESDEDDRLAQARLEASFHNAGFREIVFEYEPVAAAYFYERELERDELILIGDFGGGTSDFSLLRVGPSFRGLDARRRGLLATGGVGVAGDAFDGQLVRHEVAPRLGQGARFRSIFGRELEVPRWLFANLERWHHLSFLRAPRTLGLLHDLRREALEPEKLDALLHVVESDLGLRLHGAVERTKLALSERGVGAFEFHDEPVAIDTRVTRDEFERWIGGELAAIEACVEELFQRSGVRPETLDRVFLTGGSSFVPAVRRLFADRFGTGKLRSGAELTSVAAGLALRAGELAG
jgi:hypothetical chaperone protein